MSDITSLEASIKDVAEPSPIMESDESLKRYHLGAGPVVHSIGVEMPYLGEPMPFLWRHGSQAGGSSASK